MNWNRSVTETYLKAWLSGYILSRHAISYICLDGAGRQQISENWGQKVYYTLFGCQRLARQREVDWCGLGLEWEFWIGCRLKSW